MDRVTEILDYFMEPEIHRWILRVGKAKAERISTEAKEIGTIVDGIIKHNIKTAELVFPIVSSEYVTQVQNCIHAWMTFKEEHPEFVKSVKYMDRELVDEEAGIIGHPDFEVEEKDRWGIVDLKCAGAIRPKYFVQTAAYFHLSKHNLYTPKAFIAVLRLDKLNGTYEYKEITDPNMISNEIAVFQAYLKIYNNSKNIREHLRLQLEEELLNDRI